MFHGQNVVRVIHTILELVVHLDVWLNFGWIFSWNVWFWSNSGQTVAQWIRLL